MYERTAIDEAKDRAEILITARGNTRNTIMARVDLEESRSVKRLNGCYFSVTDKALAELQAKYTWATDF